MRTNVVVTLLCLAASAAHAADYVMRPVDPTAAPPAPSAAEAAPAVAVPGLAEKVDLPSSILVVPNYEVDFGKPNGGGLSTLFAIHNLKADVLKCTIFYISDLGSTLKETASIAGDATYTRNVRDVAGLAVDTDGFARGFIRVVADAPLGAPVMTGDFLQVDAGNNYATGDRMIQGADLCEYGEVRLLDFGTGTDLYLFLNFPQGPFNGSNPPSVAIFVYDQAGVLRKAANYYSSKHTLHLNTDDMGLPISFGVIEFNFGHSSGGYAYAAYNAEGRFSVGMNSACRH